MKILATLLEPDEGAAELDGINLVVEKGRTRRVLGYLPRSSTRC
jgi:ABC-type multidrug transport system ATPase subunit